MTYSIKDKKIFLPVNRTHIIDIAPGDVLSVEGFAEASYTWTSQDAEFMENNPDDDIYLHLERSGPNHFRVVSVLFELPESDATAGG